MRETRLRGTRLREKTSSRSSALPLHIRMRPRAFTIALTLSCSACGGSSRAFHEPQAYPETASVDQGTRKLSADPPSPSSATRSVSRKSVDATLAAGPGRFLSQIEVRPVLFKGRFRGFAITALHGEALRGSGLRLADVVRSINGHSIERPEQAWQVWQELTVASSIVVKLQREGRTLTLRFPIEEP